MQLVFTFYLASSRGYKAKFFWCDLIKTIISIRGKPNIPGQQTNYLNNELILLFNLNTLKKKFL